MVEAYLAAGLVSKQVILYLQSQIPEVQELAWYLSTQATVAELERAHSYKDKVAKGKMPNQALFAYPVLMAADIVMFDADIVPVGKDQKQHVEFARDWAGRFNHTYGSEFLKLPEPHISDDLGVIPGTDGNKMSKSYGNTIDLFASDQEVKKQIMNIVTDSKDIDDPKDPDSCNVFAFYKLLANEEEIAQMRTNYAQGGYGYGHAKMALYEKFLKYFGEMRAAKQYYEQNPHIVDEILTQNAQKVRPMVQQKMEAIRKAVGIMEV